MLFGTLVDAPAGTPTARVDLSTYTVDNSTRDPGSQADLHPLLLPFAGPGGAPQSSAERGRELEHRLRDPAARLRVAQLDVGLQRRHVRRAPVGDEPVDQALVVRG